MKGFMVLVLLTYCVTSSYAQKRKLDSLDRLIAKATTDTGRINLINKKLSYLVEVNIDSALSLSKRTIEQARAINYKRGEARARLEAANAYCYKGEFSAASANLKAAEEDFRALKNLGDLGDMYSGYGMMYGMQSKYDSSIYYFDKSREIAQQTGNNKSLSRAYQNLAVSYQMLSNYSQALTYFQKALVLAETAKNANMQAYVLINLAITYKTTGDTTRAEQTLLKAISLARQAAIKNVELYAYSNLSTLYQSERKYVKSYEYALKTAALGKQMGDQGMHATGLSNAAYALAHRQKFSDARALARQAIPIANLSKQPLNSFQAYYTMGAIENMMKNYQAAIPYYEKGFQAIKDADIYDDQVEQAYQELSKCYEKTGDFSRALSAFKTGTAIADSIRSKDNIRKATELTLNFEFDKKQQAVKAEQQKENAVAKTRQLALLVGLLLTLSLAIVAFIAFRTKHKANALLQKQKEEIQRTLAELKITQTQLIQHEKMASLGELTAGIAHEIQNPLNFVNNFAEVSAELCQETLDELQKLDLPEADKEYFQELMTDLAQNQEKIVHHGKRADSIVKGMLQHSRASSGQPQPTDINSLAEEYLRLAYHGLRAKDKEFNATLVTHLDPNLGQVSVESQEISRVLLNLFTNAFYTVREKQHQSADDYKPTVTVSTARTRAGVEIRVRDNGKGIAEPVKQKIFQPFFTTKPTGEGTGLGLSLSYDIITKGHGGTLTVDTKEGEFTEFIITLPVAVEMAVS
ncbi:tetratricopeptide repeat protein [Spirosoma taeanense]|uniref:histidine kinase n=1 Tax=Spirosoma taeanense TaxID=2735870 RepID=A0A6M5Y722_9BACT|nr:tetratricopeptide repeat protein [Spirosoma taeanense]QJW90188.1 tetratricopeptide repeat protein [Spirosoma taeanense]